MTTSTPNPTSPDAAAQAVPFTKIGAAMARGTCHDAGAMRALVATVVAVGPDERLAEAADTLRELGDAGTVRGILISPGNDPAPPAQVSGNTVLLRGIKAPYLNNAIAALRLSSLPTLVWWRGGAGELLDGLPDLADRIVLDEVEPEDIWRRAVPYFADSAFSDLRWAQLTQWRALMAHFFDIPEVRAASRDFTRLHVRASDPMAARLFAAWLTSSLAFPDGFAVDVDEEPATASGSVLHHVSLGNGEQALAISLGADTACLETSVAVHGHRSASRVVSLAKMNLTALMTEELRIRARDLALERAIKTFVGA